MANGPVPDANSRARRLAAYLCFIVAALLILASIFEPGFHVDVSVLIALLISGAGLLGVDLKIWGS